MPLGTALLLNPVLPSQSTTINSSGNYTVPFGYRKLAITGSGSDGNPGNTGNNGAAGNAGAAGAAGNGGNGA